MAAARCLSCRTPRQRFCRPSCRRRPLPLLDWLQAVDKRLGSAGDFLPQKSPRAVGVSHSESDPSKFAVGRACVLISEMPTELEMPTEFLRSCDVAQRLGVTATRIRQLVRAGKLQPRSVLTGGMCLFDESAVAALLVERRGRKESGAPGGFAHCAGETTPKSR